MKVNCIATDTLALAVTPIGDRLYKVACDTKVSVQTDEGVFLFKFLRGFTTNFRSGGVAVDSFIDQIGDERKSLCYLVHDAIYTPCDALGGEHPLSRKKGDQILRAGLLWAGMGSFKSALVYNSVRLFGHDAYWEDDALTSSNAKLFLFRMEAEMKCPELKKMFSDREIKEMREIFARNDTKCLKTDKKSRKSKK